MSHLDYRSDSQFVSNNEGGITLHSGAKVTDSRMPADQFGSAVNHELDQTEKHIRIFKALVIVSLVTGLIGFFESDLIDRFHSQETLDLLGWNGYNAILEFPTSFWYLWVLVLSAVRLGLLSFSPAARAAFAIFNVFGIVSFAITGVQVFSPFGSIVGSVGALADGAILAMAYWSNLSARFRYPRQL